MGRPDFIIAGVQKCGTTSLFQVLRRHRDMLRPDGKELHYFDRFYERGPEWYADLFPDARPGKLTGEATPAYSYDEVARDRMIADLPDLKLVVILRDPVSRAYSHYWHSRRNFETLPTFEEAIAAEPERLATVGRRQRMRISYLDRGYYVRDLRPLAEAYGDRLLVMSLEEVTADPAAELTRMMQHLGFDPQRARTLEMPQSNRFTTTPRQEAARRREAGIPVHTDSDRRPPLAPETRERLLDHFAAADAELLTWWGRPRLPWRSRANPPDEPVA